MEFQAQQEYMAKKILGTWRVPEGLFNMTKDINYSTLQGQMRIFWIYTLMTMMGKYRDMLNRGVVRPYNPNIQIALDLLSVPAFQDELYTKIDAATKLWNLGFTAEEINEKLDLGFNDVNAPWRHEAWVAWNMQTAKNALENPRIAEVVNDGTDPNAPAPAPAPKKKALDAKKQLRNALIVKNFERRATSVEIKIKSKMSRYFTELRVEALRTPLEKMEQGIVDIDWHKANEKLTKILKPLIHEGVQHGLAMGKDHAGEGKGIQDDANQQTFNSYVSAQVNNASPQINGTIKDQLSTVLTATARDGASQSLQRDALAEILKDGMRGVFNSAVTRANLIARTETASAVNGGSWMYYKAIGVPRKSWVTAHDNHVRDEHLASEGEGIIDINQPFACGLQYPGDQNGDPEEICNCRCSLAPEMD
jgi:hypothetical protein